MKQVDDRACFRRTLHAVAVTIAFLADLLEIPAILHEEVHVRSEEHTSELQSLMRISYAVFCLKKKKNKICIITLNIMVTNQTRHSYTHKPDYIIDISVCQQ